MKTKKSYEEELFLGIGTGYVENFEELLKKIKEMKESLSKKYNIEIPQIRIVDNDVVIGEEESVGNTVKMRDFEFVIRSFGKEIYREIPESKSENSMLENLEKIIIEKYVG